MLNQKSVRIDPFPVHRRPAPGAVVLQAAVDVVGIAHVGADGVELGDAEVVVEDPGLAVVVGQRGAAVLADVEPVLVGRVEPHGVEVGVQAADGGSRSCRRRTRSSVRGQVVDPLVVDRIDVDVAVVERPVVHPAHERPGRAAVLGTVDARAELGHVLVVGIGLRAFRPRGSSACGWKPCSTMAIRTLGLEREMARPMRPRSPAGRPLRQLRPGLRRRRSS